jgi:hypothetical protein
MTNNRPAPSQNHLFCVKGRIKEKGIGAKGGYKIGGSSTRIPSAACPNTIKAVLFTLSVAIDGEIKNTGLKIKK